MVLKTKIILLITPTDYKITKNCSLLIKKENSNLTTQNPNFTELQKIQTHLLIGSLNTRGLNDLTKLTSLYNILLIQNILYLAYLKPN